jgi:hypothetical protein
MQFQIDQLKRERERLIDISNDLRAEVTMMERSHSKLLKTSETKP